MRLRQQTGQLILTIVLPMVLFPQAQARPGQVKFQPSAADTLFSRGQDEARHGHYDRAVLDLGNLIQTLPGSNKEILSKYAQVFRERADSLEKLGRYRDAAADMKQYYALRPLSHWGCPLAARSLAEAGLYKDAIFYADKFLVSTTNQGGPYAVRALCDAALGDFRSASIDVNEAIKLHFSSEDKNIRPFCLNKTLALFDERFMTAAHKNPRDAVAYFGSGVVHTIGWQPQFAIGQLTSCLKLRPTLWQALNVRANCFLSARNGKAAFKDINQAIEINPTEPANYATLQRYYFLSGDFDAIFNDLSQRLTKKPRNPTLWIAKANAYAKVKDSTQELDCYSHALAIDPACLDALTGRGRLHQQLSQYNEAINDFTAGIKLQPKNYQFYKDRATCYFALEDFQKASLDLTKVIELAPDPYAYGARAECYTRLGRSDLAARDKQHVAVTE